MGKLRRKIVEKSADILFKSMSRKFVRRVVEQVLNVVYELYERMLYNQVRQGEIPKHVAIIPDGNRRWARIQGLDVSAGHAYGYEKLKQVIEWLLDLGVKTITIYALSYENCLKRSKQELDHLFNLAKKGLEELLHSDLIYRYRVKVKVIGRLEIVPRDVIEMIEKVENATRDFNERFLNIAICYGGRQDIVDAVKKIAEDVLKGRISISDINEELLVKYLSTAHLGELSDPDLVIRTSGELRVSNFLLWQIAYSELYFCDVFWPAFRRIDLLRAIRSYQQRERRFGK